MKYWECSDGTRIRAGVVLNRPHTLETLVLPMRHERGIDQVSPIKEVVLLQNILPAANLAKPSHRAITPLQSADAKYASIDFSRSNSGI
jgi:hypothetical protein